MKNEKKLSKADRSPLTKIEELEALQAVYKERVEYYVRNEIDIDYYTMRQITKAGNPVILKVATEQLNVRKVTKKRIIDTLGRLRKRIDELTDSKGN